MTPAELRAWLEPFAAVGALVPARELLSRLPIGEAVNTTPAVDGPLTCEQIATLLNRTPACVRAWCRAGELRAFRLNGREWRVHRADLAAFLDGSRHPVASTTTPPASARRRHRKGLGSWRDEERAGGGAFDPRAASREILGR